MTLSLATLQTWYEEHRSQIEEDFFTFLRFPSISTDPHFQKDIQRTADWLAEYLSSLGMKVELWKTSKHPVIFASHLDAGEEKPTLLIYHHYDVQPVDPLDKWDAPPFEPTRKGSLVFARGASDNKGQCFYSLTALSAFLKLSSQVGINIKLFIEGEEECGSVGSLAILKEKQQELQADHLLIVDAGIPSPEIPAITLGLRGLVTMQIACRNSTVDLHSGTYGGFVLNPNRALISLLSKLWDENGKVAIPGFYEDIVPLPKQEQLAFVERFNEEELRRQFGIRLCQGEKGYSLWELGTLRPTVEINGINGGYNGPGFKTVIPAEATAKLSCRLVPYQNPTKIAHLVTSFLREHLPQGLDLQIDIDGLGEAVRTSSHHLISKIVASSYEEVFGKPCLSLLAGGSVPIVAELSKYSGAHPIMLGMGVAADNVHSPNESFSLERLNKGFLLISAILNRVATTSKVTPQSGDLSLSTGPVADKKKVKEDL